MKSVLISIQPKWCELISSGKKTVEVRKTKPKLETPFKVYIYETRNGGHSCRNCKENGETCYSYAPKGVGCYNGWGKVIGEFVCNNIIHYDAEFWDDETFECIREIYKPLDFAEYGEYVHYTIADNGDDNWRENKLCKLSCLTIDELRKYIGQGINEFYGWRISNLVIYEKPRELSEFFHYCGDNPKCDGCEAHYFSNTECGKEDYCCSIIEGCKPLKRPPQSWCYVEKGE